MDHCKINDTCISRAVAIGRRSSVIACAEAGDSVQVCDHARMTPNASIFESRTIGARALIGLGAVITRDVPPNTIVIGNPGRVLRDHRFPL